VTGYHSLGYDQENHVNKENHRDPEEDDGACTVSQETVDATYYEKHKPRLGSPLGVCVLRVGV